jgi:tetratricopeptide (TPR) repeat protein
MKLHISLLILILKLPCHAFAQDTSTATTGSEQINPLFLLSPSDLSKAKDLLDNYDPVTGLPMCKTNNSIAAEQCRIVIGYCYYLQQTNTIPDKDKLLLGTALGVYGNYSDSVRYLKEFTEVYPDNAKGWCNLGGSQLKLGNTNEALQALEKAAKLGDPLSFVPFSALAVGIGQWELVKELVPRLQTMEESKETTQYDRECIFTILTTYSMDSDAKDSKAIFVRAVKALDMLRIVSMNGGSYRNNIANGCKHFKGPEIDQIRKEYEEAIAEVDRDKSKASLPFSNSDTNNPGLK